MPHLLIQADPSATEVFSNLFWLTVGFIFLVAVIGAVLARRRKDRCMKLMDGYPTTAGLTDGRSIWGRLHVYSQGVEVQYRRPHPSPVGLTRSSHMLYENEMPNLLGVWRHLDNLTEREREDRAEQVRGRSNPDAIHRAIRWVKNVFHTLRDAFSQTLTALVGQVSRSGRSTVVQSQQGKVDQIGQSLLGTSANAYEPMLEHHIGKPVVVEIASPAAPDKRVVELTGYLAEYSQKFIAIFNVEHPVTEAVELTADQSPQRDDLKLDVSEHHVIITNLHETPLIVRSLTSDAGEERASGVVLTYGAAARLARLSGRMTLHIGRSPRIDMVCSRAHAAVRHGGGDEREKDE